MFHVKRDDGQNYSHALNPKPGEYWSEMFTPIARVLMVDENQVLVQKLADHGGREINRHNPKPTLMSRRSFRRWLCYSTMDTKTWADVSPEAMKDIR